MAAETPVETLSGWRRVVMRVAQVVEPEGRPAEAIYGTLIAAGVLASKADNKESGLSVFLTVDAVLLLYWAAHVYADVLGERLETRERPGWGSIVRAAFRDWSMLRGALIPVAIFGVVRLAGASVNTAGLTTSWATVFLLGCWGLVAAVRGGSRGLELFGETVLCAALGVAVVALKVIVA